jgi:pimeloyl-ACP methyl ester carboxylesterase
MPIFEFLPSCRIYYLDENVTASNSVLLLHGLGVNSTSWLYQIPSLIQAGFRPIAPDAPGFGQSTYPGGRAAIVHFVEPITALLEKLQIQHIDVVGISMGGTMALQLALDHPQLVSRLVLVNTFAHLNIISLRSLPYFLSRFILVHTLGLSTQAKTVAKYIFPYPDQELLRQGLIEQVRQADPRAYRAAMRALVRFDVRNRLREIHCPTMIIIGERDTTVPWEIQDSLANGINLSREKIIPEAGHGVTVEKPDIFNHVLVEFLSS